MRSCVRCQELQGERRCDYCIARAVTSTTQVEGASRRVRTALAARGVVIDQRVHLELRTIDAIRRSVPTASPSLQGLTRYAADTQGRVVGRQYVTIRSGLPLVDFEACLAHELVHLALLEHQAAPIPDLLDEGMAEYVCYRYLLDDVRAEPARRLAADMLRRQGDVYATGLQIVTRTVDQIGFAHAWQALLTGRYRLSERWMEPSNSP